MRKTDLLSNLEKINSSKYVFTYNKGHDHIGVYYDEEIDLVDDMFKLIKESNKEEFELDYIIDYIWKLPCIGGIIFYEDIFGFFKEYHTEISKELGEQWIDIRQYSSVNSLNAFITSVVYYFLKNKSICLLHEAFEC